MDVAFNGHQRLDRRSLELHKAVAKKLCQRPDLLAIAGRNLDNWAATAGRSQPYLDMWRKIIEGPFDELLRVMVIDDERMTALRQASPFAGILDPQERWAIYRQFDRNSE